MIQPAFAAPTRFPPSTGRIAGAPEITATDREGSSRSRPYRNSVRTRRLSPRPASRRGAVCFDVCAARPRTSSPTFTRSALSAARTTCSWSSWRARSRDAAARQRQSTSRSYVAISRALRHPLCTGTSTPPLGGHVLAPLPSLARLRAGHAAHGHQLTGRIAEPAPGNPTAPMVSTVGQLRVTQQVVPLHPARDIDRSGRTSGGARRFALTAALMALRSRGGTTVSLAPHSFSR